jgi:hypothetical protein
MLPVNRIRKAIAIVLSLSILWLGLFSSVAQAGLIQTQEMQQQQQSGYDRQKLIDVLDQDRVQQQLVGFGVDPEIAKERVASMTDSELAQLNDQIDQLPAGSGALGIIFIILLVFLILDIVGVTDIFPFINAIDK